MLASSSGARECGWRLASRAAMRTPAPPNVRLVSSLMRRDSSAPGGSAKESYASRLSGPAPASIAWGAGALSSTATAPAAARLRVTVKGEGLETGPPGASLSVSWRACRGAAARVACSVSLPDDAGGQGARSLSSS